MVFSRRMHSSGIANGTEQLIEAVLLYEAPVRPLAHVKRSPAPATPTRQQTHQAPVHMAIDLLELQRRVACPKVVTPASQHGVEHPDHLPDVAHPRPAPTRRQLPDPSPKGLHRPGRRPAEQIRLTLEVGAPDPQVAAQELETLLAQTQLHDARLVGVQPQPESTEDLPPAPQRLPGLRR